MTEYVKIRIVVGRPKRRSGVYPRRMVWGIKRASRRLEDGEVIDLRVFQRFQREEGPGIYDWCEFSLIPWKGRIPRKGR